MNKWNRLLAVFDEVFGFKNKVKSTFRKVGQHFDERTNEHVYLIEYRVRRGGGIATSPREVKKEVAGKKKERRAEKMKVGKLVQDINARTGG